MRRLAVLLVALAAIAGPVSAQRAPRQWFFNGSALADFEVARDTTIAHSGHVSLRVSAAADPSGFAGAMTMFPAAPYLGRHVRFSAFLRTASLGGQGAAVWARADGARPSLAFVTTQGKRLVGGTTDWTAVSVEMDVPTDALTLFFGAFATARGTLWIDDASVDAGSADGAFGEDFETPQSVGAPTQPRSAATVAAQVDRNAAPSPHEAPRPLAARGLDNLVAFTRLAGYVRFFHPSEAAATTNWDELTVRGIRLVERAPNADSLVATLRAIFAPIAPNVAVYRTGARPPAPVGAPSAESSSVVFWRHFGYGVPTESPGASANNVYRSERVSVAAPNGRPLATITLPLGEANVSIQVPDPATPFHADLGAGVSAMVPLAVYSSARSISDSLRRAKPRPAMERFAIDDRATRLADVALLWMVPQHFYPYHDIIRTDWPGALRRGLTEAAVAGDDAQIDAALEHVIAALRDGHGGVSRPSTARAIVDAVLRTVEGRVVVTARGDSAAAAGLRLGDEVLAIDGTAIADGLRVAESRVSGATPQWVRYVALRTLLTGAPGSVTLRVRDPLASNDAPRDIVVRRRPTPSTREARPDKIAEVRPGVFYVDFDRVSDEDVRVALPSLEKAKGIVFDMRGYPRQVNTAAVLALLADSTIRSAHFEVPIVTQPDHAHLEYVDGGWQITPRQPRLRAKVAFLTAGSAISYAESTMGVVEENHLGAIVGETTAGTNGNVNPFTLPGGYTVRWTGMRVTKRDGSPHHGVGIRPTVPVAPTLRGVKEGRDEVLERAIQIVSANH
ncbi:MAG: S41 family peptidase [Gemmatimonadaceae bacterium]